MPKWGWKFGPRHYAYYMTESVPREQVEAKLKETLSRASKGHSWTNPWGIKHTEIVVENEVVGNIWEDVDLSTLSPGRVLGRTMGNKSGTRQGRKNSRNDLAENIKNFSFFIFL
jgi:hypothetical protein